MTYAAEVLADSPLAYWRLDETVAPTVVDSSGNGHEGNYIGTYTLDQPGLLTGDTNTCVDFSAGQGRYNAATTWADTTSMTVEAWCNPDTISGIDTIVRRSTSSVFTWAINLNAGKPEFQIRNTSGTVVTALAAVAVTAGTTHHIVGTFDGTTLRLYVDGVLAATATSAAPIATGNPICIGSYHTTANAPFDGRIDEAAVYGTALSAERVARHYLAGVDHALQAYDDEVLDDDPMVYWTFDDSGPPWTTDPISTHSLALGVVGTGPTGHTSGGPTEDGWLEWGASSGRLDSTTAVAGTGPNHGTYELWIRLPANPPADLTLVGWARLTGSSGESARIVLDSSGRLRGIRWAGSDVATSMSAPLSLNTWHHVSLTWGTAGYRIRLDGVTVGSAAAGNSSPQTDEGFHVHGRWNNFGQQTGAIDMAAVAFYPEQVSDERLTLHYLSGIYGADTPTGTDVTLDGDVPPLTGAFDLTSELDLTLDGQVPPLTGEFTLTTDAEPVILDGEVPPLTGAFQITESSDLTLDGEVPGLTGTFLLDSEENLTLDGQVPPLSGEFILLDAGEVLLNGEVPPLSGDFTIEPVAHAEMVLDGTLPGLTGDFTLDNPVTAGDSTNRVNGRDRDGIGTATWDPPVAEPPGAPTLMNFDVALQFSEPVISETAPPQFAVTGAVKPRHVDRIVIGGKDVTWYRGAPTPFPGFALTEPFGWGPTTIAFPQIAGAFEKPGAGALRWLRKGSPVRIERVDLETLTVSEVDYRGVVMGYDLQGSSLTVQVGGQLSGRAAVQNRQPPLFPGRNDTGYWAMAAVRELGLKPYTRTGPNTGVKARAFGGMSMLEYLNQIVAMTFTRAGERWTLMPTANGSAYRMKRKDRETIRGTVYADDAMTVADLHRDIAEEPNRIYMTGVDPNGQRYRFGAYPGLKQTTPPPYPMFDNSAFSQGTTDAETDTGDGVTVMIQRLVAMKYLDYIDVPGGFDIDVTRALRDLQDDADINQTGNMNLPTWRALWDLSVTGFSLRRSRILPAAERANVRQWRRSASGAIIGRNPRYRADVMKVDRNVDVGSGFTRGQAREWARSELQDGAEDNWVGTITFNTGALVDGIHVPGTPITAADVLPARDLRPGDNLWLPLMNGDGLLVHVSGITVNGSGVVQATVDTRARDDAEVWEVITRNRESRQSPYREWLRDRRASTVTKDATTPWDEAGGRLFDRVPVPGNTWTVIQIVAGQEGTIRDLLTNTNPNAEYVLAAFGQSIRPRRLQRLIGNPLSGPGRKRWEREDIRNSLDRSNVLLYVAGSDTEPCGYYPKTKTQEGDEEGPQASPVAWLTGKWRDSAGFPYFTAREPVIYLAVYADRDTALPAGRVMWPTLEAGT